jgi:hypothetical protein
MISKDKKYRTKSGREVRIYAVDSGGKYPVHGAILEDGVWSHETWKKDGVYSENLDESLSLVEVKPRIQRVAWLNVYPDGTQTVVHDTRVEADDDATRDRIACVKITIDCEEGEGL